MSKRDISSFKMIYVMGDFVVSFGYLGELGLDVDPRAPFPVPARANLQNCLIGEKKKKKKN